jgi:predicted transcriptional regulator
VREEDLDWFLYHRIADSDGIGIDELAISAGRDRTAVEAAVERLERYLLIGRSGDTLRVLSVQESLMKCKLKHAMEDLPFVIENGVIKARKNDE